MKRAAAVWKFEIPPPKDPGDTVELYIPVGAKLLAIGEQTVMKMSRQYGPPTGFAPHSAICMWMQVTPGAETEMRTFFVIPTGYAFELEGKVYLGTAVGVEGHLVFHIYEEVSDEVRRRDILFGGAPANS